MPFMTEHPDVPGWKFTITEVSNNVYRIDGRDALGVLGDRNVEPAPELCNYVDSCLILPRSSTQKRAAATACLFQ
jgi:hypothetical protein